MNICIPGMNVEKEDSDSDPEAVEARKVRSAEKMKKMQLEEKREDEAKKEKMEWAEKIKHREQFFLALSPCNPGADKPVDPVQLMKELDHTRPESFEERLTMGEECCKAGKALLQANDNQKARGELLCALHCLDFTPALQQDQPIENRTRLLQAVAPVLQSMSLSSSRLDNSKAAMREVDLGMDVLEKLPYKHSKDLRIKMRLRRAMVKGELRDFEGARKDALHLMDINPENEQATLLERNCRIAFRAEKGPEDKRWKGSLLKETRKKETPKTVSNKMLLFAAVAVVVALVPTYFFRAVLF